MTIDRMRQAWFYLGRLILSPYVALICAALFWSGNFIVGRALKGDVPPVPLNFWRWLIALSILLPMSMGQIFRYKEEIFSDWKRIFALGLTGIATFHICVYTALIQTTALNALIILSTSPMFILFISWVIFKEGIAWYQALGILISFFGALVLICHGDMATLMAFEFNRGDLWMILAVPLWSTYSILLKKRPANLPHIVLLTSSVIAGVTLMIPLYLFSLFVGQVFSLTGNNILAILYISIFASILAFFFWNRGVASIGPVKAGMYIHFMPFFGAVLSILFLEERLALFHVIGALFVGAGIFLTNCRKKK
ncbi:DMT family transporter [Desulfolithobacter sp.]